MLHSFTFRDSISLIFDIFIYIWKTSIYWQNVRVTQAVNIEKSFVKKGFIKLYNIFSVINVEKKLGEEIHEQCAIKLEQE
jgi:hypothetical protein